jgi:triacylglycerol lipase
MPDLDFRSTFAVEPVDADVDPTQFYHQTYWLARCSYLVYPPAGEPDEPDDEAAVRIKETIGPWGLDPDRFEFISNKSTQCFVACNDDVILVCFRGTEVGNRWDIVTDLVAIPASDAGFVGRVHVGFIAGLSQAWGHESGLEGRGLAEVLRSYRTRGQKVWLTGHSLGGALAELAAARLIKEGRLSPEDIGGVITFGQPRVGNKRFAAEYEDKNDLKKRHFRVVNNNDVVTRTPLPGLKVGTLRLPEFRHVGRVVFINRDRELEANIGPIRLAFGRAASRFGALFMKPPEGDEPVGVVNRILPGLGDHSMTGYERALEKKVEAMAAAAR